MQYTEEQFSFPSCGGLCAIHGVRLCPSDTRPHAVVQIIHGMAEYAARYLPFARYLCENGFAVFLHDHIGHGASVSSPDMLGYFGENGAQTFVQDAKTVAELAKQLYPDLPLFVIGHGMGSLIARKYTADFPQQAAGVVYTGTGGKNPAVGFGIFLCNLLARLYGERHRSRMLDRIAFGSYNKRTEKRTPCDWASRDTAVVDAFVADPLCGYMYTVNGMRALFSTVREISKTSWYEAVPQDLPILLLSGSEDPIGSYGKGVREVFSRLQRSGHTAVQMHLYPQARHEILNEINQDEVYADILRFLQSNW